MEGGGEGGVEREGVRGRGGGRERERGSERRGEKKGRWKVHVISFFFFFFFFSVLWVTSYPIPSHCTGNTWTAWTTW